MEVTRNETPRSLATLLQPSQFSLPFEGSPGILAVGGHEFTVEFARESRDLTLGELGILMPIQVLVPHPLKLGIFLFETHLGELGIRGTKRKLDLALAHEGNEVGRDAAPEPEILATWVFPRSLHSERHL